MKQPLPAAMMSEYVNENGDFFGRTFGAEWRVPESVVLSGGALTIRVRRQQKHEDGARFVRARPGLLDSFLSLSGAHSELLRLSGMMSGSTRSDEKILQFAKRYGGLEIFYKITERSNRPVTEHIEYCSIWQYFAGVLRSLLQIAAELYRGRSGLKEDWQVVGTVPPIMQKVAHASTPHFLHPFPLSDEQTWLGLAHFVAKPTDQTRGMFERLINTLLGLGGVRPWMGWPERGPAATRPQMAYFGRSLLSELAIQFCLRVAKVDRFLLCSHCHRLYSPVMRAPKTGQRNFCPACRQNGVPKRYALNDFRQRRRQAQ